MFSESNLLISPEALQFIKGRDRPLDFIQKTIDAISKSDIKPMVLTLEILKKVLQKKASSSENLELSSTKKSENLPIETPQEGFSDKLPIPLDPQQSTSSPISPTFASTLAAQVPDEIVILKDPSGLMLGEGRLKDVTAYWYDRFEKLRKLLLKRPDCKGASTIEQVKNLKAPQENVKIIGMVLERKEMSSKSKNKGNENVSNSISIELDDFEDVITVIFPGKNDTLIKKAVRISNDQVICIEGFLTDENVLIASDFFWPDVPFHSKRAHDVPPISALFLSDLHFGSKYFLEDKFNALLDWLNGLTGSDQQKELAHSVKYIIIAGDLIDGVGVYPNQEKNLAIIDISEQYRIATEYLKRIPEYIKVLIIPGGPHDAVRKAYPQPALGKNYATPLYLLKNVILLGNPAQFTIHGVNVLVFHGDSLDDLIQVVPGLTYQNPADIMKELVISRHITPIYGASTWIAPEKEDWMVMEEIPEIFHCGHSHVSDFKEYKGVILLNSGTFQGETDYQKSLGIQPTPGKIPIVNLQTLKVKFLQF